MVQITALMEHVFQFITDYPQAVGVVIIVLLAVFTVALGYWVRKSRSVRHRQLIRRLSNNLDSSGFHIQELRSFRRRPST
ncbi:MAG TPA: hypothetical protein VEK15_12690 [Vicinamibacteria bacterium]|nr:hypothetical protein [Vicinamibacteria bacterium]